MNEQLPLTVVDVLPLMMPFTDYFTAFFAFVSRKMNAQQPPRYNDDDENAGRRALWWSRVLSFFVLAALIITVAELVLAVNNRGLAHKALGLAKQANWTASDQVSLSCTLSGYPKVSQFNLLGTDVKKLQKGVANLTESVNTLQSEVQVLESATLSSSSTYASASGYYYEGGSSRMRNVPEAALGWIFVQEVVVLLL